MFNLQFSDDELVAVLPDLFLIGDPLDLSAGVAIVYIRLQHDLVRMRRSLDVPLHPLIRTGAPWTWTPEGRKIAPCAGDPCSLRALLHHPQELAIGDTIRLPIPPLTEERRNELVRAVRKRVEDGKVAVRNVRRDVQDRIRKLQRASDISEDDARRAQDDLQKTTDNAVSEIEEVSKRKEEEVLLV